MPRPASFTARTDIAIAGPFWQLAAALADEECVFLLDSALAQGDRSRYSYLGGRPAALLTGRCRPGQGPSAALTRQTWRQPDGSVPPTPKVDEFTADPFAALRELQAAYAPSARLPDDPPLVAGLVGFFGYEMAHVTEVLPDSGKSDLLTPDLAFMVCDEVLVYDHQQQKATLYVTRRGPRAQADAAAATDWWRERLATPYPPPAIGSGPGGEVQISAAFDRANYKAAVERCREHILCGNVFEVCLTHQLQMELADSPWRLYGALRDLNPAPFTTYLQLPGFSLVGASPERFLQLDQEGWAESRPIKGTRPRGQTPAADEQLRAELADSAKDRAENIMIVDLVRNDLGKVCRIGSVAVSELQAVESYATVHQMVSGVRGRLKPEYDALDLVRACFPGGSMTGAPKIEAMKIIDSIEPVRRGPYSGAVGFIDAGGAMDLAMVIRTIVCRDGLATFGVGGAVVADSEPDAEYDETMDKARALIMAVARMTKGGAA